MRSLSALAALLGLGLPSSAALAQPAQPAQPKRPAKVTSVCPGKILPLAVGNTWTYESVEARDSKGQPVAPPEGMSKLLPLRATKVVVTVVSAETVKQETTVKLKETITYDVTKDKAKPKLYDVEVNSTIVCSPRGKFEISPESFFFSGEPGSYHNITFTKFERKKDTTLKLVNNQIGENEWFEEISAEYKKEATPGTGAQLGGGKLEMERKFTPLAAEGVATRSELYATTERLLLTTSGRIRLDSVVAPDGKPCLRKELVEDKSEPPPAPPAAAAAPAPAAGQPGQPGQPAKPAQPEKRMREIAVPTDVCELPPNWNTNLWFANNVGLVQALNAYAHMYQLVEAKLN